MSGNIIYQEKELLLQLENGDQYTFAQLMNLYKNNIYTTAIHVVKSAEVAEEVVQDVFMIIWEKKHELSAIDNFHAYLHGIARHTIYHALKNIIQQRKRKLNGEEEEDSRAESYLPIMTGNSLSAIISLVRLNLSV